MEGRRRGHFLPHVWLREPRGSRKNTFSRLFPRRVLAGVNTAPPWRQDVSPGTNLRPRRAHTASVRKSRQAPQSVKYSVNFRESLSVLRREFTPAWPWVGSAQAVRRGAARRPQRRGRVSVRMPVIPRSQPGRPARWYGGLRAVVGVRRGPADGPHDGTSACPARAHEERSSRSTRGGKAVGAHGQRCGLRAGGGLSLRARGTRICEQVTSVLQLQPT